MFHIFEAKFTGFVTQGREMGGTMMAETGESWRYDFDFLKSYFLNLSIFLFGRSFQKLHLKFSSIPMPINLIIIQKGKLRLKKSYFTCDCFRIVILLQVTPSSRKEEDDSWASLESNLAARGHDAFSGSYLINALRGA